MLHMHGDALMVIGLTLHSMQVQGNAFQCLLLLGGSSHIGPSFNAGKACQHNPIKIKHEHVNHANVQDNDPQLHESSVMHVTRPCKYH